MQLHTKLVYNRNKHLDKNNTAPIDIYVQYAGKIKYISTNIKISPEQWDSNKLKINTKHNDGLVLNRNIAEKIHKIETIYLELLTSNQEFTIDTICEKRKGVKNNSLFVEWALDYLNNDNTLEKSTKIKHKAVLTKFENFAPKLSFTSINLTIIQEFNNYLVGIGYMQQTIHSQHTVFKSYIHKALRLKLIKESPYKDFKLVRGNGSRKGLEKQELTALENVDYPESEKTKRTVLDIFLFACYTGLRFSDLFIISKKNVIFEDGETIISFIPEKTKKKKYREVVLNIDLLFNGKPKVIFDKYYSPLTKKIFPSFTNQPFNRYLKEIAKDAKIKTTLTTHIARHTFGTNIATVLPDPYFIMELMGLTEMSTALIYVHQSKARMKSKLEKIDWNDV